MKRINSPRKDIKKRKNHRIILHFGHRVNAIIWSSANNSNLAWIKILYLYRTHDWIFKVVGGGSKIQSQLFRVFGKI